MVLVGKSKNRAELRPVSSFTISLKGIGAKVICREKSFSTKSFFIVYPITANLLSFN